MPNKQGIVHHDLLLMPYRKIVSPGEYPTQKITTNVPSQINLIIFINAGRTGLNVAYHTRVCSYRDETGTNSC